MNQEKRNIQKFQLLWYGKCYIESSFYGQSVYNSVEQAILIELHKINGPIVANNHLENAMLVQTLHSSTEIIDNLYNQLIWTFLIIEGFPYN